MSQRAGRVNATAAASNSRLVYSDQSPVLPSRSDQSSQRPYDTQIPVVVVNNTTSMQTTKQARHETSNTLPYIDDEGLPEVVMLDDKIGIMPDCDPRMVREHEQLPRLPPRNSISKHESVLGVPSRTNSVSRATVTPLGLLSDQPDMVDCPFCQRMSMTRVKKRASMTTHVAATTLFFATLGGGVVPYATNWKAHVSHYCSNCNAKVAEQRNGTGDMQPLGTPEYLREASRYEAAA